MKTLRTDKGYVVVLINKSKEIKTVDLLMPGVLPLALLNSDNQAVAKLTNQFTMMPEETKVNLSGLI